MAVLRLLLPFLLALGAYSSSELRILGNSNYDGYSSSSLVSYEVCDDSVVVVTSLEALCDSPYTFYYGNGAHRNSQYCDAGDKMTLSVSVTVTDTIYQLSDYYVTFSIFDSYDNQLLSTSPSYFCANYAGSGCTYAGQYSFSKRFKLSSDAGTKSFIPKIKIAFSTEADSGYNLGAINIDCEDWEAYVQSIVPPKKTPVEDFVERNGIILIASFMILAVGGLVYRQANILRKENETKQEGLMVGCEPFA